MSLPTWHLLQAHKRVEGLRLGGGWSRTEGNLFDFSAVGNFGGEGQTYGNLVVHCTTVWVWLEGSVALIRPAGAQ